jgi:CubicO group peptidase (beta-lactamase class C family)
MRVPCHLKLKGLMLGLAALCALQAGAAASNASLDYRPHPNGVVQPQAPKGPTSREELEAFTDGFWSAKIDGGPIAGATVAVVKDGQLFFAKGYGYEDVEKRVPVDPEMTLFRPGSVSKLFTWTAVMQLVEQGKLDLDKDVNTYLKDAKLPATFPQPITLRNIMTHTSGLEDGGIGYLMAKTEKDLIPLGEWLNKHPPARVRPPTTDFTDGTGASYSNYATGLAGYIVEIVSGMPFDDYVEQHIFKPLGMTRSTFREPLPPNLLPRMSGGYVFENGAYERKPFEFIHIVGPAGSLSATATDMAKFMLAHLQNGSLGEARILSPETVQRMHARTLSPDPALNGGALGFYETYLNGHRIIGHGGDTVYFHSALAILPEANLGLFVSINTGGMQGRAAVQFESAFFKHYFPATVPVIKPPQDAQARNERYAGTYRTLRRSFTKWEAAFNLGSDEKVVAMPDGTLAMTVLGDPDRWIEVGDGVFRADGDDVYVAFKGDDGGKATHFVSYFAPIASERIAWWETSDVHFVVIGIAVLFFITMLVSAIRQRRTDRSGPAQVRWARPALALAGVLLLGFMIIMAITISSGLEDLIAAVPGTVYLALALPLLALLPIAAAIYFTIAAWRSGAWRIGTRIHYTLATLASVAFLLVLNYWNLLGYHLG